MENPLSAGGDRVGRQTGMGLCTFCACLYPSLKAWRLRQAGCENLFLLLAWCVKVSKGQKKGDISMKPRGRKNM